MMDSPLISHFSEDGLQREIVSNRILPTAFVLGVIRIVRSDVFVDLRQSHSLVARRENSLTDQRRVGECWSIRIVGTDDLSTVFSILRRVGTLRRLVGWCRRSDGGGSDGGDGESGREKSRRNGSGGVDVVEFLLRHPRDRLETLGEGDSSDAAQSLSEEFDLGRADVTVAVVAVADAGGALGGRGGATGGSRGEEVAGRSGGSDRSIQLVDVFIVVVVFLQLVFFSIPFRSIGEVGEA